MASLGLVLTIVGLPVLFFIVLLLPDRWFSSRSHSRSAPVRKRELVSAKKIEPNADQNVLHKGTHSSAHQRLMNDPTQTRAQDTPERASLRDLPSVSDPETARTAAHHAAFANIRRSPRRQVQTEAMQIAAHNAVSEHDEKESARLKAHRAAYATSDPAAAAAISRSERLQLLNRLRNLTPEQFRAEYARKEDQTDWMKDGWAYREVARELEETERKNAHDAQVREMTARKKCLKPLLLQRIRLSQLNPQQAGLTSSISFKRKKTTVNVKSV